MSVNAKTAHGALLASALVLCGASGILLGSCSTGQPSAQESANQSAYETAASAAGNVLSRAASVPEPASAAVDAAGSVRIGKDQVTVLVLNGCGVEGAAAEMAETVRGGILSIDPGQTEGAKAIGMNHIQTMVNVIMPQALRNIMPQIGNNLIINIKDSSVLSVIGVVELFYATKGVAGAYYTYFEAFTITMVIYFILTFTCSRILRYWEKKMDGPDSYDLATTDTLAYTSGLVKFPDPNEKEDK